MSDWLSEHKIHEAISDTLETLKSDKFFEEGFDRTVTVRISKTIIFLQTVIENNDPEMVYRRVVGECDRVLRSINTSLKNYIANNNIEELKSANEKSFNLFTKINTQLYAKVSEDKYFRNNLKELEEINNSYISYINNIRNELESKIKEMDNKLVMMGKISKNIETTVNDSVSNLQNRADKVISTLQDQFSSNQQSRTDKFNDLLSETSEKIAFYMNSFRSENNKYNEEVKNKLNGILSESEKKKNEISTILNIVGNMAITGEYEKYAKGEMIRAELFRIIAFVFMLLLIAAGVYTYTQTFNTDKIDVSMTILRVVTTFLIALPAAYAIRESSHHRNNEKRYRRIHLELQSLDSYLEKLPDDIKTNLKEMLTEKYFGNDVGYTEKDDKGDNIGSSNIIELLKLAIEQLGK